MNKMKMYIAIFILVIFSLSTYLGVSAGYFLKDLNSNWSKPYIEQLFANGIFKGDNLGNANPDAQVTRAEFTSLIMRVVNISPTNNTVPFTDVRTIDWFYNDVLAAYDAGILLASGISFNPNEKITREEAMVMSARALGGTPNNAASVQLTDISKDYSYYNELSSVVSDNIIIGYEDNTFRPSHLVKRSEAAVIIKKLLDAKPQSGENAYLSSFAEQYMDNIISQKNAGGYNLGYNLENSISGENENITSLESVLKLFYDNNIKISENISNRYILITNKTSVAASIRMNYDATFISSYSDNTYSSKTYGGITFYTLENQNGKWYVASSSERYYRKDTFMLAWDYTESVEADVFTSAAPGLNVVSPTWFVIKNTNQADGVKISGDNQSPLYLNDLGNVSYANSAISDGYDIWALFKGDFDLSLNHSIMTSLDAQTKSIDDLLILSQKYKLSGINIDFEYMYVSDKDSYTHFIKDITAAMHQMGLLVSVDVTPIDTTSSYYSMCYDRASLAKAADYIVMMGYDQNGSWSKVSGSVAQLSWTESAINKILTQVPKEQLVLGVPFYTRLWEITNGKVTNVTALTMKNAQKLVTENNAKVSWDSASGQNLAVYYKNGKTYKIWLEDAASMSLRMGLVNKYWLAGSAAWSKGNETPNIWSTIVAFLVR